VSLRKSRRDQDERREWDGGVTGLRLAVMCKSSGTEKAEVRKSMKGKGKIVTRNAVDC